MRAAVPLLAALLALGCKPDAELTPGDNHCTRDGDCPDNATCDVMRSICAAKKPDAPYDLVVQVAELSEVSGGLDRYTFGLRTLERSSDNNRLDVPVGVAVKGLVRALRASGAGEEPTLDSIKSQVLFVPSIAPSEQVAAPVVGTSRGTLDEDGANMRVILAPGRHYDVTIYPLGEDSVRLPPVRTDFVTSEVPDAGVPAQEEFRYVYPDVTAIQGVLLDERGTRQAGRWLRIRAGLPRTAMPSDEPADGGVDAGGEVPASYEPDQVVSSLAVTGDDGSFSLYVLPDVLGARDYVLEVSLFEETPWATTVELQADRVEAAIETGELRIPEVPARVTLKGLVEARPAATSATKGQAMPNTSLTFVSSFPLPPGEGAVNDRDWCRAKTLGDTLSAFRCQARVTTTADAFGKYTIGVLPGNYDLYISPSRDREETRGRLTTATIESVETRPGGASQSGQVHYLDEARFAEGSVVDGRGRPIVNALIHMLPLEVPVPPDTPPDDGGIDPEGKVGLFNRASDGVSNGRGGFEFPLDRGVFDFVVRPPEESGFAWFVKPNRLVTGAFVTGRFALPAPVILAGVVQTKETRIPLANVRVDAYTFVRDPATVSGQRAMLIGSTVSDAQGNYTLRLPPSVAESD